MIYPELKDVIEQEGNEKNFDYKGFQCRIQRVGIPYSGHLCGYVVIPKGHTLYKMNYDDIEARYDYDLPAHGGLTFSDFVNNEFWVGFDCAHFGDLSPMYLEGFEIYKNDFDNYKDMTFVENNLKKIIDFITKEETKCSE